ncbi:MAG: hypothetical protein OJF47_001995 [Nitrospira sp.]|jgi:hypothetical protein|nr:MAG: hypothetical protein OJF47_001995 [Nitrospira sp.]
MRNAYEWRRLLLLIGLVSGLDMSGCAGVGALPFCDPSWKEEVLLHDGSKVVVKRSQSYGGRHEPGQSSPIKEQTLTFTVPNTGTTLEFKSDYGEDIGRANFELLALHIFHGTPYIVTAPNLCLSYNKWGRPNPPYVLFRYDSKAWQRIPLEELPGEFKDINLVVNSKGKEKILTAQSMVTAELVKKLNGELEQPEYKTILREIVKLGGASLVNCEERIRVKDGWISPGGSKAPIPMVPRAPIDVTK